MHDHAFALDVTAHDHRRGVTRDPPVRVEHVAPDDEVHDARLVFQRDERDARLGVGALSADHQPRYRDARSVREAPHPLGRDDTVLLLHLGAHVTHGVIVDGEAEPLVVEHELLVDRHGRERDRARRLDRHPLEEARRARRTRRPHRMTSLGHERGERARLGQRFEIALRDVSAGHEILDARECAPGTCIHDRLRTLFTEPADLA